MHLRSLIPAVLISTAASLQAGSRTSNSYTIAADILDAGGLRSTAGTAVNDGSVGGISGTSTVIALSETLKTGYPGQLFDVAALTLSSAASTVNETSTLPVTARQTLDDGTLLFVSAASVTWSVQTGPLSISTGGIATAGAVFQDTPATVQGIFAGRTATLGVTVLNFLPDNFGSYAGDGLDDDWQVQFFGLDSPAAVPSADPDQDGFDNRLEFTAGLIPVDPFSVLHVRIEPVAANPSHRRIIFSPRLSGRTYTVQSSLDLHSNNWISLTDFTIADSGAERTVTDRDATGTRKYYRVNITKP